ncbi:hypothetical protein NKG05_08345 [Oerskovia sp. M15]
MNTQRPTFLSADESRRGGRATHSAGSPTRSSMTGYGTVARAAEPVDRYGKPPAEPTRATSGPSTRQIASGVRALRSVT